MKSSSSAGSSTTGLHYSYRIGENLKAPLVILVHGRAGDHSLMWTFSRSIPEEFSILAPQASLPDVKGGFSWWNIEGKEKLLQRAAVASDALSKFIDLAVDFHHLEPSYKLGCGFSQGAGTLSLLLQSRPELFSGVALLAGFVIRDQSKSPQNLSKIFMAHGTEDEVVSLEEARKGESYLRGLGASVEFHEDSVGHKIGINGMRSLKNWFGSF